MPLRKFLDPDFSPPEGERWVDLHGYEVFYRISDHGRLIKKSHYRKTKNGGSRFVPSKLVQPVFRWSINRFTGDTLGFLYKTVWIEGKSVTFGLARMVYYHFVDAFDLTDRNLFIFYKDNDRNNLYYENLMLGGQQLKQKRMIAAQRRGQPFQDITPEQRMLINEKVKLSFRRKVVYSISRYTLNGKLLETYANAGVAAEALNADVHTLQKACKGNPITYRDYIWRRGNQEQISLKSYHKSSGIKYSPLSKYVHSIGQYDLNGQLVQTHSTITSAAKSAGFSVGHLSATLRGKYLTCGGFFWRYSTARTIAVEAIKSSPAFLNSSAYRNYKKISHYDLNGVWRGSYKSISAASKENKIAAKSIGEVLKGNAITAGGFLWLEGEDLKIDTKRFEKNKHYKNSLLEKFISRKTSTNEIKP